MTQYQLSQSQIQQNQEVCRQIWQKQLGMTDAALEGKFLYISNFDEYLIEGTGKERNLIYSLTGFTGSAAEVLVTDTNVHLFVDGRYFQQADIESKAVAQIEKLSLGTGYIDAVIGTVKNGTKNNAGGETSNSQQTENFGLLAEITPYKSFRKFEKELGSPRVFSAKAFEELLPERKPASSDQLVEQIGEVATESVRSRIEKIGLKAGQAAHISAFDQTGWVSKTLAFTLPNTSAVIAKSFVTEDRVTVCLKDYSIGNLPAIEGVEYRSSELDKEFYNQIKNEKKIANVIFDEVKGNLHDYELLVSVFGKENIELKSDALNQAAFSKSKLEIKDFESSFLASSKALYKTINWVKDSVENQAGITELDLKNKTGENYIESGAKALSFETIAGCPENACIIHYHDSKADRQILNSDMILLDSGAYYQSGYATDTTRTFLADSNYQGERFADYRFYFSRVLKSFIRVHSAIFKPGTRGEFFDFLARESLFQDGIQFNHGLGHGVGLNVHEAGATLSLGSQTPLTKGKVCSIEPGVYLVDNLGIRIENVVVVDEHPSKEGFLYFRPLTWVPMEESLIDESILDNREKLWLQDYQAKAIEVCS